MDGVTLRDLAQCMLLLITCLAPNPTVNIVLTKWWNMKNSLGFFPVNNFFDNSKITAKCIIKKSSIDDKFTRKIWGVFILFQYGLMICKCCTKFLAFLEKKNDSWIRSLTIWTNYHSILSTTKNSSLNLNLLEKLTSSLNQLSYLSSLQLSSVYI